MPRPKGSGYDTQALIIRLLRLSPMHFQKIVNLLDGDRMKADRNLDRLVSKGYVQKKSLGRGKKTIYSFIGNKDELTDIEARVWIKGLKNTPKTLEKDDSLLVRCERLGIKKIDFDDEEFDALCLKYKQELEYLDAYLLKEEIRNLCQGEIVYYAKLLHDEIFGRGLSPSTKGKADSDQK